MDPFQIKDDEKERRGISFGSLKKKKDFSIPRGKLMNIYSRVIYLLKETKFIQLHQKVLFPRS